MDIDIPAPDDARIILENDVLKEALNVSILPACTSLQIPFDFPDGSLINRYFF